MDANWLLLNAREIALNMGYDTDQEFESAFVQSVESRLFDEDDQQFNDPISTDRALRNTASLIEYAVHSKSIAADDHPRILNAADFHSALARLCPIWPFCR